MRMDDYKFLFKVVLVGNAGVGKTCLVRRFTQDLFLPGQDVQPYVVKDKSAWRKSTLNVANSSEETKSENSRHRHSTPHTHPTLPSNDTPQTQKPTDKDDRKVLISNLANTPTPETLTLYIRPSDPIPEQKSNLASVPHKIRDSQQSIDTISNNKVDIDQDNIETPPATRKIFSPTPTEKREPVQPSPCRRLTGRSKEEEAETTTALGDGQFDRFSATRRTRRYKRNPENNENISPTEQTHDTSFTKPSSPTEASSPVPSDNNDRDNRLKAWQEKLKTQSTEPRIPTKRQRNQTGISYDDIRKALTLPNSEVISPNNGDSNKLTYRNSESNKVVSNQIEIPMRKTKEHDNDEGFEETQSLMSESPSQGASSGGNYETDNVDALHIVLPEQKAKPKRNLSVESKSTIDSTSSEAPTITKTITPSVRSSLRLPSSRTPSRYNPSLERRNHSFRQSLPEDNKRTPIVKKSTNSTRNNNTQVSTPSRKTSSVERSNSRNSIVSSRSSLNSSTSTNTVKRMPVKRSDSSTNGKQGTPNNKSINSASSRGSIRRSVDNNVGASNRPPRPVALSFMKPTTSSSTKTNILPTKQPSTIKSRFK